MSKLSLTLACADYDRIMPLATGVVAPDGIDLTMILGEGGSWARRTELLGSVIADPSVDGGEGSIGAHIRQMFEARGRRGARPGGIGPDRDGCRIEGSVL